MIKTKDRTILRIEDRAILKTYDKRVVVWPRIKYVCMAYVLFGSEVVVLNDSGIQAWNAGEDIQWHHVAFHHALELLETIKP